MTPLNPGRTATASAVVAVATVGSLATIGPSYLDLLVGVVGGLAVGLAVPAGAVGYLLAGRVRLRSETALGWVVTAVGVIAVAAGVAAAVVDRPAVGPLVAAGVASLGLAWWVLPLAVGVWTTRTRGLSPATVPLAWSITVLVGCGVVVLLTVLGQLPTLAESPQQAGALAVGWLVVAVGPALLAAALARTAGRSGRASRAG